MTDRHSGYIVTLDADVREDSDEDIVTALRMVRHVVSVEPVTATPEQHIAQARANHEWRQRLLGLVTKGTE